MKTQGGTFTATGQQQNVSITLPIAYEIRFVNEDPGGPPASAMAFAGDFTGSGNLPQPPSLARFLFLLWRWGVQGGCDTGEAALRLEARSIPKEY